MNRSGFSESEPNIKKVYISDSPVAEDAVEYNYVSSDIEDEAESSITRIKNPSILKSNDTEKDMPSPFADVDELTKEAEYQRELQDRLQKSSIDDTTSSDQHSPEKSAEARYDEQSNSIEWTDPPTNPLASTTAHRSAQSFYGNTATETNEDRTHNKQQEISHQTDSAPSPSKENAGYDVPHSLPSNIQVASPFAQQQIANYQAQSPQVEQPQYNYQQSQGSDIYEQDAYTQQYQQLQQQHLQQQQLLVQQQMLQHQQQVNAAMEGGSNVLQRNAPVMYLHNTHSQNEYNAVTPKDVYHPYIGQYVQNRPDQMELLQADNVEANQSPRAIVAPKPTRPQKNYVEKNKVKASGQQSAKPGYSQRLAQQKVEKKQMDEWAPGMIIPRKKAASADDIIRAGEHDTLVSAEDAWSKRSQDLANAKQSRLTGGSKAKKKPNKVSNLKRYPSDSSITKKPPIPPIEADPRGYYATYQQTGGRPLQEQILPGQVNTLPVYNNNVLSPHPSPVYQSNIPSHPPIQQYSPVNPGVYAPQQQPSVYGQPEPQYQGYDISYQQGPPSGGYRHQPRLVDAPQVQPQTEVYAPQPAYDYSGYMNQSMGYRSEPAAEDGRAYDGSPYSSPHPSYSGNIYATSSPTSMKKVLNPYVTVPPIHNAGGGKAVPEHLTYTGSYLLAHQKEKEKIEQLQKGPTYKVYTMKDYKKLKLEYKLGGLGPSQDQEELKQKNEIRLKQLQYAKEVVEQEKKKPHVPPARPQEDVQQISGRQLAVQYAKHIPKPKLPAAHPITHSSTNNEMQRVSPSDNRMKGAVNDNRKIAAMEPVDNVRQSPSYSPTRSLDLVNLEDLQRRHEEERKTAAEIHYLMQQTA